MSRKNVNYWPGNSPLYDMAHEQSDFELTVDHADAQSHLQVGLTRRELEQLMRWGMDANCNQGPKTKEEKDLWDKLRDQIYRFGI